MFGIACICLVCCGWSVSDQVTQLIVIIQFGLLLASWLPSICSPQVVNYSSRGLTKFGSQPMVTACFTVLTQPRSGLELSQCVSYSNSWGRWLARRVNFLVIQFMSLWNQELLRFKFWHILTSFKTWFKCEVSLPERTFISWTYGEIYGNLGTCGNRVPRRFLGVLSVELLGKDSCSSCEARKQLHSSKRW